MDSPPKVCPTPIYNIEPTITIINKKVTSAIWQEELYCPISLGFLKHFKDNHYIPIEDFHHPSVKPDAILLLVEGMFIVEGNTVFRSRILRLPENPTDKIVWHKGSKVTDESTIKDVLTTLKKVL